MATATTEQDPATAKRRLRHDLREIRKELDLTQADVAAAMEWSPSKVIRMEHGDVRITPTDLRALLAHYGVTDQRRVDHLLDMARTARKDPWAEYRDVHTKAFINFLGAEASARVIRAYEPALVPGLLQTEEYGLAVLKEAYQLDPEIAGKRWESRQRRQELHDRPQPPAMHLVVDAAVIRRAVGGPGVMRRQLQQLKDLASRPHVTFRVIPFSAGGHPGMLGSMVLLEFPADEDPNVVFAEDQVSGNDHFFDDPEDVGPYWDRFDALEKAAASPEESLDLLDEASAALQPDTGEVAD